MIFYSTKHSCNWGFHLSITFLSSTDTDTQFKHALTLGRHVNNLLGLYHTLATLLHSHSSKTFTRLLPKKLRAHNCIQKHNKTHSHTREELWTQKSVFTYIIWKLTGGGRQQTIIPGARGGKKSKIVKTNTGDVIKAKWQALCEKDWRVYSYLLLPGFQYQHHRNHIRCFPFHWLTHKETHKLPALFDENNNTTKRLIYRQTPLNKQLLMPGY